MRLSTSSILLSMFAVSLGMSVTVAPAHATTGTARAVPNSNTCPKPVWPRASLRHGEQGTVTLGFRIDLDGRVGDSHIVKSSGFPMLDMAAKEGIARCRFKPATIDGKPETAWTKVQYVWTLESKPIAAAEQWRLAREGAARDEAKAEYVLARLYMAGGAQQNIPEALRLFALAAQKNHADAQFSLAIASMNEKLGPRNFALAFEMASKAAKQGNTRAQYALGLMLSNGRDVPPDPSKAIDWLRQAHAGGEPSAGPLLGAVLVKRAASPAELAEGVAMLVQGDAAHEPLATFHLARCYENGHGVERDYARAASLYTKAAIGQHKPALLALANLYERGHGMPADPEKASRLRAEAAQVAPGNQASAGTPSEQ